MEAMKSAWYDSPDHGQLCQVIEAQSSGARLFAASGFLTETRWSGCRRIG